MTPLIVKPGEGKAISPIGTEQSFWKAIGSQTGGSFALLEQNVAPGHGPRRHVHSREDESFFILDGEIGFEVGDRSFVAGPGTFVFGPRGIPHRFWNSGTSPARFLLFISPAGMEPFLEESSRVMAESPTDLARQAALAAEYGIAFV
jgi:mannose-6-phosphate isomerase-like protein (cupin superfamily)